MNIKNKLALTTMMALACMDSGEQMPKPEKFRVDSKPKGRIKKLKRKKKKNYFIYN